jgi:hypothetical protein
MNIEDNKKGSLMTRPRITVAFSLLPILMVVALLSSDLSLAFEDSLFVRELQSNNGFTATEVISSSDDIFPQENFWVEITPFVTWCGDPQSTVTVKAHIVNRDDVVQVELGYGYLTEATLYDDGTHGDEVLGDNIFTASDVQFSCYPNLFMENLKTTTIRELRVITTNDQQLSNFVSIAPSVPPSYKGVFEVVNFDDQLSATAYAFFIEDQDHEIFSDYPLTEVNLGNMKAAPQKLYSVLPDDFDMVVVTPGMRLYNPNTFSESTPRMFKVSNNIQNIGLPLFNNAASYGSQGRLKGFIYHSFGFPTVFAHEAGHIWGADIRSFNLVDVCCHWNQMTDIGGLMSDFYCEGNLCGHFAYNGDNTWRLIPNSEPRQFAPLDLYITGLISPEQVPPIHILDSPDLSDPMRITASSVTVTIEDIMASEGGVRIPDHTESQKDFNVAYVVIQDEPFAYFSLLGEALTKYEQDGSYSSFTWATLGLTSLNGNRPNEVYLPIVLNE